MAKVAVPGALRHILLTPPTQVWLPPPLVEQQLPRARVLCKSAKKACARLAQKERMLKQMDVKYAEAAGDGEPAPATKVTLDKVKYSFCRNTGPGGQNVNKVETKVDMRFNVMAAHWLPVRIRLKLLETEKNRVNSNGELVITSAKSRRQKENVDEALEKIQAMIDAAAYVPPPPSDDTKKRIARLANAEDQRRLQLKKQHASKKTSRREKGSWD